MCCIRYSTYVCDCWIPLLCAAPLPSGVVVEPLAGCRQWSNYSGMWITLFMMMAPPMFFSVCTNPPHLKPHHIPLTLLHPLIHFDQEFSRSTDSNLTMNVLFDASITIRNRRPKGTIFPKYALFHSVTHLTLLHLSLTGVYKSDQLLSQLDIGWTQVGHEVDLCFSWTSVGHQVDFCHLWTLDEDMLDVGWTPVGLLCLLDMRWTPVGHQMPDTCRREQRPLLEGIRPVSRSLSVLGSSDDLSSYYYSWWWWRWTPRTLTILWTTWLLWSVLSWLSRVPLLMVVDINSTPKRFSLAAHLSALKCSELASTDFNPFYSKSIAHCSERLKCS